MNAMVPKKPTDPLSKKENVVLKDSQECYRQTLHIKAKKQDIVIHTLQFDIIRMRQKRNWRGYRLKLTRRGLRGL